jgi:DNA-binding CsgD family transcriptional regulator
MNDLQRVSCLKKKEIATLFLICIGQSNAQIALTLNEPDKTTSSRITRLYKKLDVKGKDEEKRLSMMRRYCPIVRKLIKSIDDIKFWIPESPNEKEKATIKKIDDENPIDDDEGENYIPLLPFSVNEQLPPPTPPKQPRTGDNCFKIIIGAVILILSLVVVFFISRNPPPNPPTQTPSNPTKNFNNTTATSQGGAISTTKPADTLIPDTITPIPPTSIIKPSLTSVIPTQTPTIYQTLTITPTPTLTPIVLFQTHFDQGIYPNDWNILKDANTTINNGVFTPSTEFIVSIGDETWKNYRVTINFARTAGCFEFTYSHLKFRAKSLNDALDLIFCERAVDLHLRNGNVAPDSRVEWGGNGAFVFDALENHVKYYGKDISLNENESGFIVVDIRGGSSIREIKVIQLP